MNIEWPYLEEIDAARFVVTTCCRWHIEIRRDYDHYEAKIIAPWKEPKRLRTIHTSTYESLQTYIRIVLANPWEIVVDRFVGETVREIIRENEIHEEDAWKLLIALDDFWHADEQALTMQLIAIRFPDLVQNYHAARKML